MQKKHLFADTAFMPLNIGEIHYHKENKTNGGKQIEFSAESNQFEKKSKVGRQNKNSFGAYWIMIDYIQWDFGGAKHQSVTKRQQGHLVTSLNFDFERS